MSTVAQTEPGTAERQAEVVRPRVEILDSEKAIVLIAEMPGVNETSTEVVLDKNVLTVRGRAAVEVPEGYEQVINEWTPTDYERVFTVSDEIDRDGIEAVVRNGVLTLTLPRCAKAQTRKIQIKAG